VASPGPEGPDTDLARLIRKAGEEGLQVTLRVTAGALPPARALTAAGNWAERLRTAAAGRGLALGERLAEGALIELAPPPVHTTAHPAGADPVPDQAAPRHTGPAASADHAETPPWTAPEPERPGPRTESAPDVEVERVVGQVLSEFLGGAEIDPTLPFFRLGATSLTLVRAHGRLAELLDPGLEVVDMFTRPTVRQLAAHITERRNDGRAAASTPVASSANGDADPAARRADARRLARRRAEEAAR
jgi:hypothetical protein